MASQVTNNAIDLTQEADEEEEELIFIGEVSCTIVGIRYYTGKAHPGEYVKLVREPNNPYDRNAIRVDNMSNQKVGHIKATMACKLAPIMDKYVRTGQVTADATIPSAGDAYTIPCDLEFYGKNAALKIEVASMLDRERVKYRKRNRNRSSANTGTKSKSKSPKKSASASASVSVSTTEINWESAQKNLDDMFDQLHEKQLKDLPKIPVPPAGLSETVRLLPHQIQGIKWLYHRETSNQPVPFYRQIREKGRQLWFSEITNSSQPNAPAPVKGSILADDMGLGKTLQSIGLMLANPPAAGATSNKTTLVLCPVSVMSTWVEQIETHVKKDQIKVAMYHGTDRSTILSTGLNKIDVLVGSYGTISADFGAEFPSENTKKPATPKKAKKLKSASIFNETFHRLILDEAHTIRNHKSRTFRSCLKLNAVHRLCLTGTPISNRPEDILSLLSFLRVEPLGDRDIFRRAVSQPIRNGDDVGLARLRAMMAHVALRRNKGATVANLKLPNKTVELRSIEFPPGCRHKQIHDALFESARIAFEATLSGPDGNVDGKGILNNYSAILETLMRIRQACISASLVPPHRLETAEQVLELVKKRKGEQLTAQEGKDLLEKLKGAFEEAEAIECAVCLTEMEESTAVILKPCSHVFCEPCISTVAEQLRSKCPLCRVEFKKDDMIKKSDAKSAAASSEATKEVPLSQQVQELGPSPKLLALAQAIGEMKDDEKGVIFSQFTKFIDIIEPFLENRGFSFARIDGTKSASQRAKAMQEFNAEKGGPRFILCSLHAASTGITLTRANHCFMMDTWWNVSVENQAMDRVHRIGQTRDTRIVRFVMKDTIEERMIQLQEAKAAMGKGALEKLGAEEKRKARSSDFKKLFSILKDKNNDKQGS